jgi:hypothetical protein
MIQRQASAKHLIRFFVFTFFFNKNLTLGTGTCTLHQIRFNGTLCGGGSKKKDGTEGTDMRAKMARWMQGAHPREGGVTTVVYRRMSAEEVLWKHRTVRARGKRGKRYPRRCSVQLGSLWESRAGPGKAWRARLTNDMISGYHDDLCEVAMFEPETCGGSMGEWRCLK